MGSKLLELNPEVIPNDAYAITHVVEHDSTALAAFALSRIDGTKVFIKAKDATDTPNTQLRMVREADILQNLNHPQIPRLLSADLNSTCPYIVTEQQAGTPYISAWLKKYPAPRFAARLVLSALDPLEYAHEQGILHRDIKTKNLVMPWQGIVSLIDFELSLGEEDEDISTPENTVRKDVGVRVTEPGKVRGTAGYLSPERCYGKRGTQQSDVYSMGIVLYELLYGKLPHKGSTREIAIKQCADLINFSNPEGRNIPDRLAKIVDDATQKIPSRRYQSAAAMSEDLRRYLQDTPERFAIPKY